MSGYYQSIWKGCSISHGGNTFTGRGDSVLVLVLPCFSAPWLLSRPWQWVEAEHSHGVETISGHRWKNRSSTSIWPRQLWSRKSLEFCLSGHSLLQARILGIMPQTHVGMLRPRPPSGWVELVALWAWGMTVTLSCNRPPVCQTLSPHLVAYILYFGGAHPPVSCWKGCMGKYLGILGIRTCFCQTLITGLYPHWEQTSRLKTIFIQTFEGTGSSSSPWGWLWGVWSCSGFFSLWKMSNLVFLRILEFQPSALIWGLCPSIMGPLGPFGLETRILQTLVSFSRVIPSSPLSLSSSGARAILLLDLLVWTSAPLALFLASLSLSSCSNFSGVSPTPSSSSFAIFISTHLSLISKTLPRPLSVFWRSPAFVFVRGCNNLFSSLWWHGA